MEKKYKVDGLDFSGMFEPNHEGFEEREKDVLKGWSIGIAVIVLIFIGILIMQHLGCSHTSPCEL